MHQSKTVIKDRLWLRWAGVLMVVGSVAAWAVVCVNGRILAARCSDVTVGWDRERVVTSVGGPDAERGYVASQDPLIDGGADTVLIYHQKLLIGYGVTWKVFLRSGRVVFVLREDGR